EGRFWPARGWLLCQHRSGRRSGEQRSVGGVKVVVDRDQQIDTGGCQCLGDQGLRFVQREFSATALQRLGVLQQQTDADRGDEIDSRQVDQHWRLGSSNGKCESVVNRVCTLNVQASRQGKLSDTGG